MPAALDLSPRSATLSLSLNPETETGMTRIGGPGIAGGSNIPVPPQAQQPQAQQFPPRADAGTTGEPPGLDLSELESRAQTVRSAVIQQGGTDRNSELPAREIYPWPIRVFRQIADAQEAPPAPDEQLTSLQNPSQSLGVHLDLTA